MSIPSPEKENCMESRKQKLRNTSKSGGKATIVQHRLCGSPAPLFLDLMMEKGAGSPKSGHGKPQSGKLYHGHTSHSLERSAEIAHARPH